MDSDPILIALTILALLAVFVLGLTDIEAHKKRAEYAQALFTIFAFAITAYWFFVERKGMPHANVSQSIVLVPLGKGLVAVEAHLTVENLGQRLLKIGHVDIRLQLLDAERYDYGALNGKRGDEYWKARRPTEGHKSQFQGSELQWPIFRRYDHDVDYRIEPGEKDLIVATFLMKCRYADHIRVASDIYNPAAQDDFDPADAAAGGPRRSGGWKARSFADLKEVCSGEGMGDP
ncbi:hypothetical protein B2G71_03045 [Novosphingobium sp. PC22D]|uniref:hypothetical protein n=1 Tax=Novosphingobium sp. PC22D TaxID=1962403 RepID=UPI000BF0C069|nr:hypothetical protein [Novosphingobium sp. PC22D]PEQ14565.1 hypothetical protein B2G71_03045 [Novosphingobium sp. PC22D]